MNILNNPDADHYHRDRRNLRQALAKLAGEPDPYAEPDDAKPDHVPGEGTIPDPEPTDPLLAAVHAVFGDPATSRIDPSEQ